MHDPTLSCVLPVLVPWGFLLYFPIKHKLARPILVIYLFKRNHWRFNEHFKSNLLQSATNIPFDQLNWLDNINQLDYCLMFDHFTCMWLNITKAKILLLTDTHFKTTSDTVNYPVLIQLLGIFLNYKSTVIYFRLCFITINSYCNSSIAFVLLINSNFTLHIKVITLK